MKDENMPTDAEMQMISAAGPTPTPKRDFGNDAEDALDEALEESFPASDPPSSSNFD